MMMNLDFEKPIFDFINEVEGLGFNLCLIGGAVRDLLKFNVISKDLDFEVRSQQIISDENWENEFQKLIKFVQAKKLKHDIFPYLIIRVYFQDFVFEFSSPRIEEFQEENHAHHNFNAKLSSQLTFKESFKRRDFTLNAIGIDCRFKQGKFELVDPFNGKSDLENNVLRPINDDFYRDSVRFLRMIRFNGNGYNISDEIKISNFNLTKLSDYHFKNELQKSEMGVFLDNFISLIKNEDINDKFLFFKKIEFSFKKVNINSFEELLAFCMSKNIATAVKLGELLNFPKNVIKDFENVFKALRYFQSIDKLELKHKANQSLKEFSEDELFKNLRIVIEKEMVVNNYKNFQLSLKYNVDVANTINITNEDMMKIDAPFRSAFKYHLVVKKWIDDDQDSYLK